MNRNISPVSMDPIDVLVSILFVGYRFHPTDEELINDYLEPKNGHHYKDDKVIGEINVCNYEPWDLPDLSMMKSDDQVWYFFCRRHFKYPNSRRSKRTTEAGFWKPTGKPIPVKAKCTKKQIGTKKTLVFYEGRSKGVRTGWIMHEYECVGDSNLPNQGEFVLCKLKKKPEEKTNKGEPNHQTASASRFNTGEPNHHTTFDFENQNSNEIMANLGYDESEPSQASNLGDHNPDEISANSACNEGEIHRLIPSNFENDNTSEICQLSSSQFEGESPSMVISSNFEDQSYDKDELSGQMASDIGNKNLDKEIDISTVDEGAPSDFANQNHKKIDMSTPKDEHCSQQKTSLESNEAEAMLLEEFLSELETFYELESSVNPASQQPVCTVQSPSYISIDDLWT